jgi:hypothetical protein
MNGTGRGNLIIAGPRLNHILSHSSRNPAAMGRRAARMAGNKPPIIPINADQKHAAARHNWAAEHQGPSEKSKREWNSLRHFSAIPQRLFCANHGHFTSVRTEI